MLFKLAEFCFFVKISLDHNSGKLITAEYPASSKLIRKYIADKSKERGLD